MTIFEMTMVLDKYFIPNLIQSERVLALAQDRQWTDVTHLSHSELSHWIQFKSHPKEKKLNNLDFLAST